MKIALFNVKYSPNLGDGIIAECLEWHLRRRLPQAEVKSIDLAGRATWTEPGNGRKRALVLAILARLPRWLQDAAFTVALGAGLRWRLRPFWRAQLDGVDQAVFGGGQLIQDVDLNFPMKIDGAVRECQRRAIPFACYGVGVAPLTSQYGRRLLSRLLASPKLVFCAVRDRSSHDNLKALGVADCLVVPDPGLLASEVWPRVSRPASSCAVVGVCITHPSVLNHHASQDLDIGGDIAEHYGLIVDGLVAAGYDVLCFTNGAAEDEMLLSNASPRLQRAGQRGDRVAIAPRSRTPKELATLISQLDGVIAHRLHTAIVAYSYGIVSIGLSWDAKVDSFFESVGRGKFVLPLSRSTAAAMAATATAAISEGIDPELRTRRIAETKDGIRQLADALAAAQDKAQRPADARLNFVLSDNANRHQPQGTASVATVANGWTR